MGTITLGARGLIALVFAIAALTKLPDPAASRKTFREFGVSERLARLAVLLAPAELAVVVGLVFVPTARWSAVAALLLLLVFIGGMLNALRLGRRPDCGCFGGFRPAPIGISTLVRNGVLVALSGVIVAAGPGPALDQWTRSHSAWQIILLGLGVLVVAAGLVFGAGATVGAASQASVHPSLEHRGPGIGEPAPDFSTSDTDGGPQTLASLLASGEPLILVFGSAGCSSCAGVLSQLARWQATMAGRLQLAAVVTGDTSQAQQAREEYGLSGLLIDPIWEISRSYGVRSVPAAVAVSPGGVIVNGPAVGPDAVEDLIRLTLRRNGPTLGQRHRMTNAA